LVAIVEIIATLGRSLLRLLLPVVVIVEIASYEAHPELISRSKK